MAIEALRKITDRTKVVIGIRWGNTISIEKGDTVAQPLRTAALPSQGDKDALGGPICTYSATSA
jgi:hypothetical protein